MDVISAADLPRWQGEKAPPEVADDPLTATLEDPTPFPVNVELNDIITLWHGKIWQLQCDAIVNAAEDFYADRRHPISEAIFRGAGPNLELEVTQLAIENNPNNNPLGCRTGDAIITNAYNLPCSKIIHTVGPRFNEKYRTAAENMLHSCYRTCLQTLVEHALHTIAFACIHSDRKHYACHEAAPIALRTIRRFLERYPGRIRQVILVVSTTAEFKTYEEQLALYFPRSKAEERAALILLPRDTGNELGETVSAERQIRITPTPAVPHATSASAPEPPSKEPTSADSKALPSLTEFGRVSVIGGNSPLSGVEGFSTMQGDVDARKKEALQDPEEEAAIIYQRYLRKGRTDTFSDIDSAKVIYKCGPDVAGRPTVALVGARVPSETSWPRLLLYFIKLLDPLVARDYTVVYFHTHLQHRAPLAWLRRSYQILPEKYKKNLKAVYIVHPTWMLNISIAFLKRFVSDKFWTKVVQVADYRMLYTHVPPQSISVPEESIRANQEWYGEALVPPSPTDRRRPQDFL